MVIGLGFFNQDRDEVFYLCNKMVNADTNERKISLADVVHRKWLRLCKIYNKPNYLVGFDEVLRNVESEEGIQIFYNFIVDRINEWVKREEECKLDCDNI